jgi:hypothetical protein
VALQNPNLQLLICNFLDFTTPVRSQRQADVICFDFSSTVGPILQNLLLRKLSSTGFPDGYVSWFRSFLTNRQSRIRVFGTRSLHLNLFRCATELCPGPLPFNVFVNDLYNSVIDGKF